VARTLSTNQILEFAGQLILSEMFAGNSASLLVAVVVNLMALETFPKGDPSPLLSASPRLFGRRFPGLAAQGVESLHSTGKVRHLAILNPLFSHRFAARRENVMGVPSGQAREASRAETYSDSTMSMVSVCNEPDAPYRAPQRKGCAKCGPNSRASYPPRSPTARLLQTARTASGKTASPAPASHTCGRCCVGRAKRFSVGRTDGPRARARC
jgi:hypothetical protein